MTSTLQRPVEILTVTSRSITPTPIRDARNDDQTTPTSVRQRSDTMMTTSSSSSSFPQLQTPETPSILDIMSRQFGSPEDELGTPWNRKSSFDGLGIVSLRSIDGLGKRERMVSTMSEMSMEIRNEEHDEVDLERALPEITTTRFHNVEMDDDYLDDPSAHVAASIDSTTTPTSSPHNVTQSLSLTQDGFPFPPSESGSLVGQPGPNKPEYERTKSSFQTAVRKKLDRSKSSFYAMRGRRETERNEGTKGGEHIARHDQLELGPPLQLLPKRSRLRSLMSLSNRSHSSTSLRSSFSVSSRTTSSSAILQTKTTSNLPQLAMAVPNDEIRNESLPHNQDTADDDKSADNTGRPDHSRLSSTSIQVNAEKLPGISTLPTSKGKTRARSPFSRSRRPELYSSMSSAVPLTRTMPAIITSPLRTNRPRATSMPLVSAAESNLHPRPTVSQAKIDFFGTLLPKEMKIMILRRLVEAYDENSENGKWDGEAGGRRQLIRLTRVSDIHATRNLLMVTGIQDLAITLPRWSAVADHLLSPLRRIPQPHHLTSHTYCDSAVHHFLISAWDGQSGRSGSYLLPRPLQRRHNIFGTHSGPSKPYEP